MATMVEPYPRANEVSPFYPEDPGDIVRSKPRAIQKHDYNQDQELTQRTDALTSTNIASTYDRVNKSHNTVNIQPQSLISVVEEDAKSKENASPRNLLKQNSKPNDIQPVPAIESEDIEDSTTAILRNYTSKENGRPTSFHLSPTQRPEELITMSDVFRVEGKECVVTLEEDRIKWSRRQSSKRKSGKKYLSAVLLLRCILLFACLVTRIGVF